MTHKLIKTDNYLLVVDDNKDIEENMWTVKDGKVREVSYLGQDNGYAIIAHLPLNGLPILEGVDLLPPIDDDVIELADKWVFDINGYKWSNNDSTAGDNFGSYIAGYNKAREKYKYTEEDVRKAITMARDLEDWQDLVWEYEYDDIIQSIHQYPTEFETEDVLTPSQIFYPNDVPYCSPKTITTAQGVQWVGKYK
jgi:hypothetical protein